MLACCGRLVAHAGGRSPAAASGSTPRCRDRPAACRRPRVRGSGNRRGCARRRTRAPSRVLRRRGRRVRRHGCACGLCEHRLLEPPPERGDRNAVDDFGAERVGRADCAPPPRRGRGSQVEHFVAVELADGRAVRALHVVGEDLELRLGVDARLGRSAAGCGSTAPNRCCCAPGAHHDLAVEHRVRGAVDDALVQLAAHAVRLRVVDEGVRVGELALADQRQPVDRALRRRRPPAARRGCSARSARRARR